MDEEKEGPLYQVTLSYGPCEIELLRELMTVARGHGHPINFAAMAAQLTSVACQIGFRDENIPMECTLSAIHSTASELVIAVRSHMEAQAEARFERSEQGADESAEAKDATDSILTSLFAGGIDRDDS